MKVNEKYPHRHYLSHIATRTSHFIYNHATIIVEALKQEEGYEPHIVISMDSDIVFILESTPLKDEHLQ